MMLHGPGENVTVHEGGAEYTPRATPSREIALVGKRPSAVDSGGGDQLASAARIRSATAASSSSAAGLARRKSRSCSPSIGTR